MDRYDDYTPHIFYGDETPESDVKTNVEENKTTTRRRPRSVSAGNKRTQPASAKGDRTKGRREEVSLVEKARNFLTSRTTSLVLGIILAGMAAYFLISFVSYLGSCISDQSIIYNHEIGSTPSVSNKGGEGGARLSEFFINQGFGLGALVLIIWLICISMKLLIGKPHFKTVDFTIKCLIAFITLSLIVGLLTIGTNTLINWGGYHGRYVNEWIIGFFGWWGAVILCLVMISLFVVICMRDIIKWIIAKKKILDEKRRVIAERRAEERAKQKRLEEERQKETELDPAAHQEVETPEGFNGDLTFATANPYPETEEEVGGGYYAVADEEDAETETEKNSETSPYDEFLKKPAGKDSENAPEENTETGPEEDPMVVNVNHIAKAEDQNPGRQKGSMYKFPPFSLLESKDEIVSVNETEQLANKEKIRQTLLEYGVPIVSITAHVGPTVTLYEIKPDKGNRISKIKGLVNEIAMSLAAVGVRIIAPLPGKGTIGIEVANLNPQTVTLRSILESRKYQESKALLPLALGSTITNEVYIADLASIPHLLVAGATGKGKSVGLNVIIMSLLFKKRPDELKFVMFDPKMVEFHLYSAIQKQYLAKLPDEEEAIITDMNKVVPTLNSLCIEMDNRYQLLKEAEVRKLEEYNKLIKAGKFKDKPGHRFLPYIVVVVDEYADLMMTAGKDVEIPIARLAQKARAVGIHVIIATQRPSTTVITGNIKNNFTGRIAFQVLSLTDSRVILDTSGAQQLIGKGDMLILNNSELVRAQCAFIDTHEVKAICEHISEQPYPADSPYILPEPQVTEGGMTDSNGNGTNFEKDPLYDEIRSYVIASGIASTSNIQRKYQLGYNRAGRIMDQLEADGVVGPSQGGKGRTVLM